MLDLRRLFSDNGLKVDNSWYRTSSGTFAPVGVILHHTAGNDNTSSMNLLRNGRTGVPGPLCNVGVRKDGTLCVITNTRANHAGSGSGVVLNETRKSIAPSGDAAKRGLKDDTTGNGYYYGFEVVNLGNGTDPYPAAQLEATFKAAALICDHYGWPAERVIQHREWSRRKIDMSWRGDTRGEIRKRMAGANPKPTPIPEEDDYMIKFGQGPKQYIRSYQFALNRFFTDTGGAPSTGWLLKDGVAGEQTFNATWEAILRLSEPQPGFAGTAQIDLKGNGVTAENLRSEGIDPVVVAAITAAAAIK